VTNTLAYYDAAKITTIKSLTVQAPAVAVFALYFTATYDRLLPPPSRQGYQLMCVPLAIAATPIEYVK
jgi:hypothetical protein